MNLYTHLTIDEREQLFLLHYQGNSIRMIAEVLKRNPSTISRELARNTEKESYSPTIAQSKYTKRKSNCGRKLLLENTQLKTLIKKQFLNEQWSPEQIAARLKLEKSAYTISFNTIYRAIYRGDFNEKNT